MSRADKLRRNERIGEVEARRLNTLGQFDRPYVELFYWPPRLSVVNSDEYSNSTASAGLAARVFSGARTALSRCASMSGDERITRTDGPAAALGDSAIPIAEAVAPVWLFA